VLADEQVRESAPERDNVVNGLDTGITPATSEPETTRLAPLMPSADIPTAPPPSRDEGHYSLLITHLEVLTL